MCVCVGGGGGGAVRHGDGGKEGAGAGAERVCACCWRHAGQDPFKLKRGRGEREGGLLAPSPVSVRLGSGMWQAGRADEGMRAGCMSLRLHLLPCLIKHTPVCASASPPPPARLSRRPALLSAHFPACRPLPPLLRFSIHNNHECNPLANPLPSCPPPCPHATATHRLLLLLRRAVEQDAALQRNRQPGLGVRGRQQGRRGGRGEAANVQARTRALPPPCATHPPQQQHDVAAISAPRISNTQGHSPA